MTRLTIKTHSESRREHELFEAILTLAGSSLTHDWRIVESDPADAVLISFDTAEQHSAWDAYAEKYPVDRLIAYTDKSAVDGARWLIQRPPESMPRLSDVVRVLNAAAHHLKETCPAKAPSAAPIGGGADRFHPARHLAGVVQEALDDGQCRACHMPDGTAVFILPQENAAYTAAAMTELSKLCRVDIGEVAVRVLGEGELRAELAQHKISKRRPLVEFLWFSILAGSNGRLLAGTEPDEPVHLKEWPGHVRLPFYAMYHDIATQMAADMTTLAEIAKNSAAPLQNVIDLHNACAYQGLLLRGEEGRAQARRKTEARQRIRAALRPFCQEGRNHAKLVVVGTVGAGKTTALTTLSETPPILTEANPSDAVADRKPTTTIAMEYGEIRVSGHTKLQVYGTPGQKRFDFMGEILSAKSWGVLILIDNTEPDALAELAYYLETYAGRPTLPNVAVGISHYDRQQLPSLETYQQFLRERDYHFPVGVVDTRDIDTLGTLICAMAENLQGVHALSQAA